MVHLKPSLTRLYGNIPQEPDRQTRRYQGLLRQFKEYFGVNEAHLFSVAGRTELGGNHTDHNHGRVLAAAVNLDTIAAAAKNAHNTIALYSGGYPAPFVINLNDLTPRKRERGKTHALIRGIAARLTALGYKAGGFNAVLTSEVLPGSGLSSSASIEILIATIFNELFNEGNIPELVLAQAGQYAENEYFGKPCGLMDQLACASGGIVAIDCKDPQQPRVDKIAYDFSDQGYSLLIVNSGGNHADLTDEYAAIPAEMRAVARLLGKSYCREITFADVLSNMSSLRRLAGDRAVLRALHFLQENERVGRQMEALQKNDLARFLRLVQASGDSSFKWLQNIYSVKDVRQQALAVALALTETYIAKIGAGACRVHGGGFGGTIQVFLPKEFAAAYTELMTSVFGKGSVLALRIRAAGSAYLGKFVV